MKRLLIVLLATTLVGYWSATSQAIGDDVAVIVNKANPADGLTFVRLRKILLGQEAKWPNGKKIVVLMTTPGQSERDATLKVVCGMNETSFNLHFMHASFNGESADPPKTLGNGVQVRQAVALTADGVGFIKASQVDDSVRIVPIDGSLPGQPLYKLRLK